MEFVAVRRTGPLTGCCIAAGTDALSKEAQRNATVMFFSLVRCLLASKRVLSEHKLSRLQFEWLLGEVKTRFVGVSCALQNKEADCAWLAS